MTKKQNLLLISLAITIGLFTYLAIHHYAIKLGLGGSALCSINAKVNCDAAALSSYSEVFNTPIAILGAIFNLFLFGLILFFKLNWIDSSIYLKKAVQFMLGSAAIVSIVMGIISVSLVHVICPFCLATYLFSFINFYLGYRLIEVDSNNKDFSFTHYFSEYKSYLILLALIPVTSWIISGMIRQNYGLDEILRLVPEKISQWNSSPVYEFDPELGLSNKIASNKIVLVEFADFKCPHCRVASQTIDTFLKGRTDIKFIYKPFPLDGTCNVSDQMQKGDGSRCTLAAWVLCADKLANKGWDMHHWIFEKQEEISAISNLSTLLPEIEKLFNIKGSELTSCADSSTTYDLIKKSSAEGHKALVSGTPSIYLNGKKLGYGHIMEVLKTAVNSLN
jgi:protein-disulfide isomerase/uncharacterized membrane protein